ncbi:hypothetical protein P8452_35692 [Trifolium repens]|nr:hypothetical protein P8452_35692 [Trifolium repens]
MNIIWELFLDRVSFSFFPLLRSVTFLIVLKLGYAHLNNHLKMFLCQRLTFFITVTQRKNGRKNKGTARFGSKCQQGHVVLLDYLSNFQRWKPLIAH